MMCVCLTVDICCVAARKSFINIKIYAYLVHSFQEILLFGCSLQRWSKLGVDKQLADLEKAFCTCQSLLT